MESKCENRRFRKSKRKRNEREEKKDWLERRRVTISTAKLNGHHQNTINLIKIEFSEDFKPLLFKGPSFVPRQIDSFGTL